MRYLLMIYEDPTKTPQTPEAWSEMLAEYGAYTGWLQETGQLLGGEALKEVADATTVQVREGRRMVTDGPFAETKEQVGGVTVIEVPDLDAALLWAGRMATAVPSPIEIRPFAAWAS